MRLRDFEDRAADLFGYDIPEARELLVALEDRGYDLRDISDRSRNVWADAADIVLERIEEEEKEEVEEDYGEEESPYSLDDSWPDDDWLDAGDEWELTGTYEEVAG
jgi:hypothetical protein